MMIVYDSVQVAAYSEDFEAERRDRERLVEEKQSLALRHEAEVTSLKLQLDRYACVCVCVGVCVRGCVRACMECRL